MFGDEGSAYWIAREGLTLCSRMSDGRAPRGALYELVRQHFALDGDLDLCAAIYGQNAAVRSQFASLAKLVAQAADAGDGLAQALFVRAAGEFAEIIGRVRKILGVPASEELLLSYSGGLFQRRELILAPLRSALAANGASYSCHRAPPGPRAWRRAARDHAERRAARCSRARRTRRALAEYRRD